MICLGQYFLTGIEVCREEQYLKRGSEGFAPCKGVVDSYYYCLSQVREYVGRETGPVWKAYRGGPSEGGVHAILGVLVSEAESCGLLRDVRVPL